MQDLTVLPDTRLVAPGTKARKAFTPAFSIYLDLVRFLAALSVVLHHTWNHFSPIRFPGHEAVVVFFVLSGYVITYTALRPGMTLSTYLQHRIARIVPVAWVALLLGLVLAREDGMEAIRATLANMIFLGQSGTGWIEAPLNEAYWSLNYEVWYYLIFAAWVYSAPRYRIAITALAMLVAGPKILMLFPVWLMGVWLYRKMPVLGQSTAWTVFTVAAVAAALLWWFDVSSVLRSWLYEMCPPAWRAHHTTQVIYDILLGIVVTAHFCAAAQIASGFGWLLRFEKPIRYLASFSFSIYAFHGPLGQLYRPGMGPVMFYTSLALGIFVLAQLTERRVGFYRMLLQGMFSHGPLGSAR